MSAHIYTGSFTPTMGGEGRGISVWQRRADGTIGDLVDVAELDSPSHLAVTDRFVFAASDPDGGVASYRREPDGALTLVSRASSGGADPCHVRYEQEDGGGALYVANYSAGTAARLPVDAEGKLGEPVVAPPAQSPHGPEAGRQDTAHAHATEASERGTVLVAELGLDRILEYDWSDADGPRLLHEHVLPPNAGPRHLAWAHGTLIVVGELDAHLHLLQRRGDDLVAIAAVPTTDPANPGERTYPAHIEISADGRLAYVSNRHRDTLAVFDVSPLAEGALPTLVQEVSSEGEFPRHFWIDGDLLYVADQFSNTVAVLELASDGTIGAVRQVHETAAPTFVAVG